MPAHQVHDQSVGGQPGDASDILEGEPSGLVVLAQRKPAILHVAQVAVHHEEEGGVLPFHRSQVALDGNIGTELLPDLAHDRLLSVLAFLPLAAGELPAALEIVGRKGSPVMRMTQKRLV